MAELSVEKRAAQTELSRADTKADSRAAMKAELKAAMKADSRALRRAGPWDYWMADSRAAMMEHSRVEKWVAMTVGRWVD